MKCCRTTSRELGMKKRTDITKKSRTTKESQKSKKSARLSDLFLELANYAANDHQTTQDLLLSQAAFGSKYRKGKANRLLQLETKNIKVAYENLRIESARTNALSHEIDAVLRDTQGNLHSLLTIAKTPDQATAVLRLWFLNTGSKGCQIQVTLDDLRTAVGKLELDDIDTEIARNLIYPIGLAEPVQDLAKRVGLVRQSIYARLRKIFEKLEKLRSDKTFAPLIDAISEAAQPTQVMMRLPLQHPLVNIALLPPVGEFGHVADLVRLAITLAATQESGLGVEQRQTKSIRIIDFGDSSGLEIS